MEQLSQASQASLASQFSLSAPHPDLNKFRKVIRNKPFKSLLPTEPIDQLFDFYSFAHQSLNLPQNPPFCGQFVENLLFSLSVGLVNSLLTDIHVLGVEATFQLISGLAQSDSISRRSKKKNFLGKKLIESCLVSDPAFVEGFRLGVKQAVLKETALHTSKLLKASEFDSLVKKSASEIKNKKKNKNFREKNIAANRNWFEKYEKEKLEKEESKEEDLSIEIAIELFHRLTKFYSIPLSLYLGDSSRPQTPSGEGLLHSDAEKNLRLKRASRLIDCAKPRLVVLVVREKAGRSKDSLWLGFGVSPIEDRIKQLNKAGSCALFPTPSPKTTPKGSKMAEEKRLSIKKDFREYMKNRETYITIREKLSPKSQALAKHQNHESQPSINLYRSTSQLNQKQKQPIEPCPEETTEKQRGGIELFGKVDLSMKKQEYPTTVNRHLQISCRKLSSGASLPSTHLSALCLPEKVSLPEPVVAVPSKMTPPCSLLILLEIFQFQSAPEEISVNQSNQLETILDSEIILEADQKETLEMSPESGSREANAIELGRAKQDRPSSGELMLVEDSGAFSDCSNGFNGSNSSDKVVEQRIPPCSSNPCPLVSSLPFKDYYLPPCTQQLADLTVRLDMVFFKKLGRDTGLREDRLGKKIPQGIELRDRPGKSYNDSPSLEALFLKVPVSVQPLVLESSHEFMYCLKGFRTEQQILDIVNKYKRGTEEKISESIQPENVSSLRESFNRSSINSLSKPRKSYSQQQDSKLDSSSDRFGSKF